MSSTESAIVTPPPRVGVTDFPFDRALEFLKALNPNYGFFDGDPATWIYRGQQNANWWLRARALREPKAFEEYGLTGDGSDPAIRSQMQQDVLDRFQVGLDRLGLEVPVNMGMGHATLPLMALAQHHGLPTTLLDWTYRAVVAAYFAAVEAADHKRRDPKSTHLAVWALQSGLEWLRRTDAPELSLYQPPAATNPNLRAQAGLLMLRSQLGDDWPCLERHLRRLETSTLRRFPLYRLTLPVTEAPRLLRLLSYEGIDGASMFPGPDGVVRAMRERALWNKQSAEGNP